MTCTWNNEAHTEILLTKSYGETLILRPKDCIKFEGREDGVRIEEFARSDPGIGPIGFTYLPWRTEGRWATFAFSLAKGDIRRLVCKPTGIERFVWGQHIDWDTVELIPNPETEFNKII